MFVLQDQITERVVGVVEPSVQRSEIERARRKPPESLGAYDLYLRALPHMASRTPADARVAAGFLEEALKLEPDYAAAHAVLAWCRQICFVRDGFLDSDKTAALRHARAAIGSGSEDAAALAIAAVIIAHLGKDFPMASNAIDRALSLNASSAIAHYFGAHIHSFAGHPAEATSLATRALRLSPFDPLACEAYGALGIAAFQEARCGDAASLFLKAVQLNPRFTNFYCALTASLALAGRSEEARSIVAKLLELMPSFRLRMVSEFEMVPAILDKLSEGARLAGIPE